NRKALTKAHALLHRVANNPSVIDGWQRDDFTKAFDAYFLLVDAKELTESHNDAYFMIEDAYDGGES
ncbi:MAG: hypothetical protein AAFQ07_12615, partial [Chloroflexota bacterium]